MWEGENDMKPFAKVDCTDIRCIHYSAACLCEAVMDCKSYHELRLGRFADRPYATNNRGEDRR
ncbi:MAG: hypothetical protein D3907_10815 [Candidatus Electrothrix sp. AUS3]|nr:hypothetical protein [Candidatus Electrothrix gigas]